jgi:hypothetical protein
MDTLINGKVIINWRQPIENDQGIKCFYGTVTNEGLENLPDCMIASFQDLEIKGIIINGRGFMKAVYAWNKISISYSLLI